MNLFTFEVIKNLFHIFHLCMLSYDKKSSYCSSCLVVQILLLILLYDNQTVSQWLFVVRYVAVCSLGADEWIKYQIELLFNKQVFKFIPCPLPYMGRVARSAETAESFLTLRRIQQSFLSLGLEWKNTIENTVWLCVKLRKRRQGNQILFESCTCVCALFKHSSELFNK